MLVSVAEAKRHLASLLDDRRTLTRDLQTLRDSLQVEPPAKVRAAGRSAVYGTVVFTGPRDGRDHVFSARTGP